MLVNLDVLDEVVNVIRGFYECCTTLGESGNAEMNTQRKFCPVQCKTLPTNPRYRDGHKKKQFPLQQFHETLHR